LTDDAFITGHIICRHPQVTLELAPFLPEGCRSFNGPVPRLLWMIIYLIEIIQESSLLVNKIHVRFTVRPICLFCG